MKARYFSLQPGASWYHPQPLDTKLRFFERYFLRVIYDNDGFPDHVEYGRLYASEHEEFCMACREQTEINFHMEFGGELRANGRGVMTARVLRLMTKLAESHSTAINARGNFYEFTRDGWKGETYARPE